MSDTTANRVLEYLTHLTPSGITCATWDSSPPPEPVHPREEALIQKVVSRRRDAFRAGRHAAHSALAAIERDCDSILIGTGREPLWPEGCVGSISHTKPVSVAIVALQESVRAVGVDIESASGLSESEWNLVFNDPELARLRRRGAEAEQAAMLAFSAKETVFKLQYPHTGRFIDLPEASIELIESQGVFLARLPQLVHDALAHPGPVSGRFCSLGPLVLTTAWIHGDRHSLGSQEPSQGSESDQKSTRRS